jgi:hypothetical protein
MASPDLEAILAVANTDARTGALGSHAKPGEEVRFPVRRLLTQDRQTTPSRPS